MALFLYFFTIGVVMIKTLATPISEAQSQAMEYVGLGCCNDAPVRPPIQNIDRGSCESVCQSDNGCNGFSYGNLQKTLNSKTTQYCVLFMVCNTSTGGDASCKTALDGAWESFESWAKKKGSSPNVYSDVGIKQEGESCGSCFSPSSNYDCGKCISGLECVPDENAHLLPDLPSRCRVPQSAKCSSWNGKACGAGETANVGRGPGSCNSNNDCPCCAPFCSKYGYCQNYQ